MTGSPKLGRASSALVAAAAVLVAIWWLDHLVIPYPTVPEYDTDPVYYDPIRSLGYFAMAGGALVLARLAWWSRSAVVGTTYLIVGAGLALLPWIYVYFVPDPYSGTPYWGALPASLASAIKELRRAIAGPLDAFGTVGGVLAIVGVFVLARWLRDWVAAREPDSETALQARSRAAQWSVPKLGWAALAIATAAVSLAAIARVDHALSQVWYRTLAHDSSFVWDQPMGTLLKLGAQLAVAGLVLVVALPSWRSRSAAVGVIYAVAGIFFTLLPMITDYSLGSTATTAKAIFTATNGPLNAVTIVGAAMAVVGVVVVGRSLRDRLAAGEPSTPAASASWPTLS